MKKLVLSVPREREGIRLDQFLAEAIPEALGRTLSKAKIRKLIMAGAVFANGRQAGTPGHPLRAGAAVTANIDEALLDTDAPSQADQVWRMSADAVLFEDEFLIAVNKPPGLPTQPTLDKTRPNLFDAMKTFMTNRDGAQAYVGLHHRLDRDTSGIVLFTKKKEANLGVSILFKDHLIQKSYLAIALPGGGRDRRVQTAELADRFTVRNFLRKDSLTKGRMRVVKAGGDLAITHFQVLGRSANARLVQAEPQTGRMHQIRVHLAEMGWPIFADATYGRAIADRRLALHAAILTFPHPITSVKTEVRAPIPPDFQKCLHETDLLLPSALHPGMGG